MDDLQFAKVEEHEANLEQRAVLRVIHGDERNPLVKLHMPHVSYWSDPMAIDEAAGLIRRDALIAGVQATVDVIDDDNLWPDHWQKLEAR